MSPAMLLDCIMCFQVVTENGIEDIECLPDLREKEYSDEDGSNQVV